MKSIGFDDSFHDVYESVGTIWRAIWPVPVIAQAAFIDQGTAPTLSDQSLVFREECFDAITRVRRGRLYVPTGGRPGWALPHPIYAGLGSHASNASGWFQRDLRVFDQYQMAGGNPLGKLLSIGASESVWQVLAAERISTGEYLLTLKARRSFGVLPELNVTSVPEIGRLAVIHAVSKLTEAVYRESPSSIVDRARDAVQSCLATWAASKWNDDTILLDDLGALMKCILHRAQRGRKCAFIDAAELVRILHARGKWNERRKHNLRPILEDDAELALRAAGFLLHEFEWARASA